MKNKLYYLLLLVIFTSAGLTQAVFAYDFQINQKDRTISVAKKQGNWYRWYRDNNLVYEGGQNYLPIQASGLYAVDVRESSGAVYQVSSHFLVAATIIKIITIGDSTVSTYSSSYYPLTGWGQVLQPFFNSASVQVMNKAVGGTSSKSFYNLYWSSVKTNIAAGDFVFIQFGINDRNKADTARYAPTGGVFESYLKKYIDETRAKGAYPVLVTTVRRNSWNADGVTVYNAWHDHPIAVRTVAAANNVPLIDLDAGMKTLLESVGQTYSTRFLYNNYLAGEYPNYPSGKTDHVHFQEMGAIEVARLVTEGVRSLSADVNMAKLVPNIRNQYTNTITKNITGKDSVTSRTLKLPTGLKFTLKTIPKKGSIFSNWKNAAGTVLSSKLIHTYTTSGTASYSANYTTGARLGVEEAEEQLDQPINIYPNPFVQNFKIKTNDETGVKQYIITSEDGTVVEQGALDSGIKETGTHWKTGIYLINSLDKNGKKSTVKILKK